MDRHELEQALADNERRIEDAQIELAEAQIEEEELMRLLDEAACPYGWDEVEADDNAQRADDMNATLRGGW
jgi:hypothetical protein